MLGHAVSGWFGTADLATQDLDTNDDLAGWFRAFEQAAAGTGFHPDSLSRMLTIGPSASDAVGTTEAGDDVRLLYPSPMVTADVVLATASSDPTTSSVPRVAGGSGARRTLTDASWKPPGTGPATTTSTICSRACGLPARAGGAAPCGSSPIATARTPTGPC